MPRPTAEDYQRQAERVFALFERFHDAVRELEDFVRHADEIVRYDSVGLHEFNRFEESDFLQHLTIARRHIQATKRDLANYQDSLHLAMEQQGISLPDWILQRGKVLVGEADGDDDDE